MAIPGTPTLNDSGARKKYSATAATMTGNMRGAPMSASSSGRRRGIARAMAAAAGTPNASDAVVAMAATRKLLQMA